MWKSRSRQLLIVPNVLLSSAVLYFAVVRVSPNRYFGGPKMSAASQCELQGAFMFAELVLVKGNSKVLI